jgi:hypothetical protein
MTRPDFLNGDDLHALEQCFAAAWKIVLPKLEVGIDVQPHQDRLAKIVLDHLAAGHEPGEPCALASAEKFLADRV